MVKDLQLIKEVRNLSFVGKKKIVEHGGSNSYMAKRINFNPSLFLFSHFLELLLFSPPAVLSIDKVPVHLLKVFLKISVLKPCCTIVAHCTAPLLTTLQEAVIYE